LVEQVLGVFPGLALPSANALDVALPQPLMVVANSDSPIGVATAGPGATVTSAVVNSPGVIVALANLPSTDGMVLVAVSVPEGTAGTGFSFVLPISVRDLLATGAQVQVSLPDGGSLPAWLRFDPLTLRFDASATPAGALPMEVLLTAGDRRIRVVISEREG